MYDNPQALREVIPNQTGPQKHQEFIVHTGGVQSTLQDIKLPDTAGGYVYKNPSSSAVLANRTLYWRTIGDVLELSEISLNFNLINNQVRFKFQDSPVLEGGVSIHESWNKTVVVLVSTVTSVHRMTFPHPLRLEKTDPGNLPSGSIFSILSDANSSTPKECQYLHSWPASSPLPHTAASFFTQDEEAVFVVGNSQAYMTCVKLGKIKGMRCVTELAAVSTSYLDRVWSSFTRAEATGNKDSQHQVQSMVIVPFEGGLWLVGISRDHKIRVWNLQGTTHDLVLTTDVVQFTAEAGRELGQGAQGHRISTVVQPSYQVCMKGGLHYDSESVDLCLFLCFRQQSQFMRVNLRRVSGQLNIVSTGKLYSPHFDLVSYVATDKGITAVWTNGDGETVVRRNRIGSAGWDNVPLAEQGGPLGSASTYEELVMLLEQEGSAELGNLAADLDPRQLYLGALFAPGAFRAVTLARTVGIFRRNLDNTVLEDTATWEKLKTEVVNAVVAEIQNSFSDYEVTDEDYVAMSRDAWSRFYSCAIQYKAKGRQPMGIVAGTDQSAVMIIRRDIISWCRPVEALELVVISEGKGVTREIFSDVPHLGDDPALATDVLQLLAAVGMISDLLPAGGHLSFRDCVNRLESPDLVSRNIAAEILADQDQPRGIQEIVSKVQQVQDIARAIDTVLYCLELDSGSVSSGELDISGYYENAEAAPRVFSSRIATSIVAESLKQQVTSRLILSQQLLILQQILLECGSSVGLGPSVICAIKSTFLPRTTVMVHCYNVLSWITQVSADLPPSSVVDMGLRQISLLKLSDKESTVISNQQDTTNPSLLELFLSGPGRAVRVVVGECSDEDCWSRALPPLVNMTAQLLWPRCASSLFLSFLLRSSLHSTIQEYCRMLSTWCDWHPFARQFLLATAYLNMGEEEKACDMFLSATGGIPQDSFLTKDLLNLTTAVDGEQQPSSDDLTAQYFLKVISLLQQFPCPDLVISIAETALSVCPQDHPERATLSYILFSHHLKLGHNDDAYDAMVFNPDTTRRKDSLRQFLMALFDRGELSQLASYPYIDMIDDVESIIESRARSADLSVNNYYDFLYSFHVMKENYRKAAHVMYECGSRLGNELCNLEGLNKQVQSYLACLNCLQLVSPNYRWLVKPISGPSTSPKRLHNGAEKAEQDSMDIDAGQVAGGMEVVDLAEIKKELVLSQARLKLTMSANGNQGSSLASSLPASPGLTPSETIALLTTANLYTCAVDVCRQFELPMGPVVDGLAGRAVRMLHARPQEQAAAWNWLADNRLGGADVKGECAVSSVWNLLEHLVTSNEKKGESVLHRAALLRLFGMSATIPTWLITGYKSRNCSELIALCHQNGHIVLAAEISAEYLEGVLGHGKEYFGLETSLQAHTRAAIVPWNILDRVMMELNDNRQIPAVGKAWDRLSSCVSKYLSTVERVTRDSIANRA